MKKLTVALVVGALFVMLVAPGPAAAKVQFGLKAGGNMANITGADAQDLNTTLKNKVGFVGGVFLAFNTGNIFTLQLEVLYTMKGTNMTFTDIDTTYIEKIYGNYIEIPLLFKFRIPTPLVSPFIFAGPAVGFKLSEKLTEDGTDVPLDQALLKNNDYGAIFGGGVNIGSHFQLDVRYSMGLAKIVNPENPGDRLFDVKNGVLSATVGIAF